MRRSRWSRHPDSGRARRELWRKEGISALIPIHADTIFYGVLILGPRARHRLFSGNDLSLLESICLQIGLNLRSRQLERRASQAEKLISLGTLAAGLAHELRNPLVSIQTFAGLLDENGNDAEFQREFSEIMQRDVARIVGIVENISSFATRDSVEFSYAADRGGHQSRLRYHPMADFNASGVVFEFENNPVIPPINGNYNQLLQVFINLFQNGVQALSDARRRTYHGEAGTSHPPGDQALGRSHGARQWSRYRSRRAAADLRPFRHHQVDRRCGRERAAWVSDSPS